MPKLSTPRKGSLQYWPRKRIRKFLPSLNWKAISKQDNNSLLGFIGYKVAMTSILVKDNTPNSLTKGQEITLPCTILEVPHLKILSVRFYKNNKVIGEVLAENLDKELKKKIKLPKKKLKKIEDIKDYDDIKVIVYSVVKSTRIKKKPDIIEIGIGGKLEDKLNFAKENINKEISFLELFKEAKLVDIRGVTKGKGTQGPVKRFGITLKQHKSEKGVRRPGSIGPWHPARVVFRVPMAGQTGLFTRAQYNNNVILGGKILEEDINPPSGFKNYGKIKTEFLFLKGSIPGPAKRQLLITLPLRKTKKLDKKNFEFLRILR